MYKERRQVYQMLEKEQNSKVLLYITGDRPGLSTQIHPEVLDLFVDHLDAMTEKKKINRISLILYTRGGQTIAAWSIVNLLRQFCEELEIVIPSKAHSAGTIICLGADRLIMTKQATLSPIDPNFNGPLNPTMPGQPPQNTVPVSVEAINGYFDLSKEYLRIKSEKEITNVLMALTNKVHPLVLGETYRVRNQIKMLANRLLSKKMNDKKKIDKIVSFLTEDSGSHDYTINRREAREELGLPVDNPSDELYNLIRAIYQNIRNELELNNPYNPQSLFGTSNEITYCFKQALIESLEYGSHSFVREGILRRIIGRDQHGLPQVLINDQQIFQGWRYETAS